MVQTVWKLNQIADAILGSNDIPLERMSHFAGGASGVSATKPLAQPASKNERRPSAMVNPIIQSTVSSPAPPMEPRRRVSTIINPYSRPAPDAGAILGTTETQNYQRTDPTRERVGAVTSILNFGGERCPALGGASSDLPSPTAHMRNETESYVRMRSENNTQDSRDGNGAISAQMYEFVPSEGGFDAPLPGEMMNDGMEWLQSLFSNGIDTQILPVWD